MAENKDEKQTKDDEKTELKDFDSIEVNSPEELQKLLDSLGGSGNNGKQIKKIGLINRLFPNIFVNLIFYIIFIGLITLAIQGYLDLLKFDELYKLFIFIIAFGIVDTLGRDLLYSKLPFVVITSFGFVILLLTVLSSIGIIYIIPGLEIRNFGIYAVYIVVLMICRMLITNYLSPKVHAHFRKKKQNKK